MLHHRMNRYLCYFATRTGHSGEGKNLLCQSKNHRTTKPKSVALLTDTFSFPPYGVGAEDLGMKKSRILLLIGSRPAPHWVQTCSSLGPDLLLTGSRPTPHWVQNCSSLGPDLLPTGPRPAPHWAQTCSTLGPDLLLTGPRPAPHWVETCSSLGPDLFRSLHSLLSNGYRERCPRGKGTATWSRKPPYLGLSSRMVELWLHFPIYLHGKSLNCFSTETKRAPQNVTSPITNKFWRQGS
jgi:hypothetical protein